MGQPTRKERRAMYVDDEVEKILAMFRVLKRCYEDLPDKSGINPEFVKFDGFDGNNEFEYLRAAESLTGYDTKAGAYDSHRRNLTFYQTLMQRWKNSVDEQNLTHADLVRITAPLNFN